MSCSTPAAADRQKSTDASVRTPPAFHGDRTPGRAGSASTREIAGVAPDDPKRRRVRHNTRIGINRHELCARDRIVSVQAKHRRHPARQVALSCDAQGGQRFDAAVDRRVPSESRLPVGSKRLDVMIGHGKLARQWSSGERHD